MRSLEEIQADLRLCSEYKAMGTLQAALKFSEDLRVNILALSEHIDQLKLQLLVLEVKSIPEDELKRELERLRAEGQRVTEAHANIPDTVDGKDIGLPPGKYSVRKIDD